MKRVLGAILWAAPLLLPLHASAGENRPNIVPIVCDDLGHGDVQSLNPERGKIKTPHIDNRASQGMATPLVSVTHRVFCRSQRAGLVSRNAFAFRNSGCPHTVVGVFTPRRPAFGSAVSRMAPVFLGRTSSGFHMTMEPRAVHTVWTQDCFRCPSSHVGLEATEERGEQLGSLRKTRS